MVEKESIIGKAFNKDMLNIVSEKNGEVHQDEYCERKQCMLNLKWAEENGTEKTVDSN